ncbi:MAG: DUF1080 domain-containing protein [Rhodothermales bacterium]
MKALSSLLLAVLLFTAVPSAAQDGGWVSLFDGTSLDGWQVGENASTFSVEDGVLVVHGPRAHLFYAGPVENHDFDNFEFQADVMTTEGSNSGIYFHTEYQESGWPSKGFEVQVNNSHTDWKRTAGLYNISDVREAPAVDDEWFTMRIRVEDKRIRTYVNDSLVVDFTEPTPPEPPQGNADRVISSGTFALQGHDPDSRVYYRDIMVRSLPE